MRTTVTLDADVARELKAQAQRTGEPFKRLINRVIRAGLKAQERPEAAYVPVTYDLGPASADVRRAADLAAALEDEEIIRRYRRER